MGRSWSRRWLAVAATIEFVWLGFLAWLAWRG